MSHALRNIEFFSDAHGGVMISDENGIRTYQLEERETTDEMFAIIEEWYPQAFKALTEEYKKSKANVPYFKYLIVHRFIRCNFANLDRKLDIDEFGRFSFENVDCPLVGECRWHGVICNPERSTMLTARQKEVMKLYCDGLTPEEIADRLYISVETVKTTKRNAFDKSGVHDIREFMVKYKDIF